MLMTTRSATLTVMISVPRSPAVASNHIAESLFGRTVLLPDPETTVTVCASAAASTIATQMDKCARVSGTEFVWNKTKGQAMDASFRATRLRKMDRGAPCLPTKFPAVCRPPAPPFECINKE